MQVSASDVSSEVRSAFDFSVDKFPLFGPENMKTDQYGLFRSDTGYIEGVKSISGRYVPHTYQHDNLINRPSRLYQICVYWSLLSAVAHYLQRIETVNHAL